MQRLGHSPRVAAHFSLAFISIEIRLAPVRQPVTASSAERARARAELARTLAQERHRAETRLLHHG
jgi:hypothetical protein